MNYAQNAQNIDLMQIFRTISNSDNPINILQGLLRNHPQLQGILGMFSNSQNPMPVLDQFFGGNPVYQQIKKDIEGKNQEEIMQYLNNKYKEQGVDFNSLIQKGNQAVNYLKQSGFIK